MNPYTVLNYPLYTDNPTYNGKVYDVTVTSEVGKLLENDQLDIRYVTPSKNVGTYTNVEETNAGTVNVTVKDHGTFLARNYILNPTATIHILKKEINSPDVDVEVINPEYNGEEQTPTVIVHDSEAGDLPESDYDVNVVPEKDVNTEGNYDISVDGDGNYEGT